MNIYQDDVFASLKTFEFDESQLPPPEKYNVKHLHPMYGVTHTEETIKQMSEAKLGEKNPRYGVKLSTETKQKLSKKLSGSNNPSYGVSPSAETRAKQSAKLKDIPQKKVVCIHCGATVALGTYTKRHGVKCASHRAIA
jgi:hypothetical protein